MTRSAFGKRVAVQQQILRPNSQTGGHDEEEEGLRGRKRKGSATDAKVIARCVQQDGRI